MEPYFYSLSESVISSRLKNEIISFSLDNLTEFKEYRGQRTGKSDGNNIYYGDILNKDPEVLALMERCTLKCFPIIMLHRPHTKVIRHVDNPNKRNCVLITPLFPEENYTSTFFWEPSGPFETWEDQELTPIAICDFKEKNSVLLNTLKVHSLQSEDSIRINFQLCFENDFEIVVDKIKNKSLFRD
jgi:hypothetical protein